LWSVPGGLAFVAGQTATDPTTGLISEGGIREQTRQALSNIAAILASGGLDLSNVVKVSVFLADLRDFQAMNEEYAALVPEPYPARTTVQAGLAPGALIEIDAVAARPA